MVHEIDPYIYRRLENPQLTEFEGQQQVWQGFYDFLGEKMGKEFVVPSVDRSEEEVKLLEKEDRTLIYVHPEIAHSSAIPTLITHLPGIGNETADKWSHVEEWWNVYEQSGWLDVEKSIDTPDRGLSQIDLEEKYKAGELEPQTVNTYLIASLYSLFMNGEYLDPMFYKNHKYKRSISRLLGTRLRTHVRTYPARGDFHRLGNFSFIDIGPLTKLPKTSDEEYGGRSVGRAGRKALLDVGAILEAAPELESAPSIQLVGLGENSSGQISSNGAYKGDVVVFHDVNATPISNGELAEKKSDIPSKRGPSQKTGRVERKGWGHALKPPPSVPYEDRVQAAERGEYPDLLKGKAEAMPSDSGDSYTVRAILTTALKQVPTTRQMLFANKIAIALGLDPKKIPAEELPKFLSDYKWQSRPR